MSDVMLLGVLCMPPGLWGDDELDRQQRYSRYLQAARRIEDDARELDSLRKDAERWRHASTSRNFGITFWCEHGQGTCFDALAEQRVDAAMAEKT